MKNRGKSVKTEQVKPDFASNSNKFSQSSSSSTNLLCKKHPKNSSQVGICAYCLTEKLIKLVCSECGEQRISSCSCSGSGFSSYRNSSCTMDIGSVGRISFLIENEKGSNGDEPKTLFSHLKMKQSETEDVVLFKRSSSCVEEVKKTNGFWKIGKYFKKKREKEGSSERNRVGSDQISDVSRSRSLSSFMGDKFHQEMCNVACSSAKISDFSEIEGRKSGFKGGLMDDDEDSEFIDLKIDLLEKSKTEHSVFKMYDDQLDLTGDGGGIGSSSCRITVNDRGIKKVKNSNVKSWKWNFRNHSGNNDDHILKSEF
ncbi:hypothetical protein Hanom_Chr08g00694731 [Helianthus anomalus]